MIIELLFNIISLLIKAVFIFIKLPQVPDEVRSSINTYLDMVFENLDFLRIFRKTRNFNYSSNLSNSTMDI